MSAIALNNKPRGIYVPEQLEPLSVARASLIALSICGYPLVSVLPLALGVDSRPFSLAFRAGFLVLALAVISIGILGRNRLSRHAFWTPFALFWGFYSARLVHDVLISEKPLGFQPEEYLLWTFGVVVIPAIAFGWPVNGRSSQLARRMTFVAAIIAVCGQVYFSWGSTAIAGIWRYSTDTLNSISLGTLGGTVVILGVDRLLAHWRHDSGHRRLLSIMSTRVDFAVSLGGLLIGLASLYVAAARMPVLATGLCVALQLAIALMRAHVGMGKIALVLAITVGASALLIPLLINFGGGLLERLEDTLYLEDKSDDLRFYLWQSGFEQFLESPLLGSGIEESTFLYYPHNLVLEAFMATGVFGGLLYVFIMMGALGAAVWVARYASGHEWIALMFILYAIQSQSSGSLWSAGSMVHLMVAVFAIRHHVTSRLSEQRSTEF